jgi:transcriptional regulator with GAF, ATPase, and Fis domain
MPDRWRARTVLPGAATPEIPILARVFLTEACARSGRAPLVLSDAAVARLGTYPFPGNVRELKNAMDYGAASGTVRWPKGYMQVPATQVWLRQSAFV